MILNCMIVDDEPLAIKLLAGFVERTPFLRLAGTYLDPLEAVAALSPQVDILFLDVQMPGLTGVELSRLVQPPTRIIFTTAFKEYAYDSYEVRALDYLLKPVSYSAFLKAATYAKTVFEQASSGTTDADVPEEASPGVTPSAYLFVKNDAKLVRVDFDRILFVSGLKDYVRFHLLDAPRPLIALSTMKSVEDRLPDNRFCRVHRSYIVALDKIESVEHNRIRIGNELIPVSPAYQELFMKKIGG